MKQQGFVLMTIIIILTVLTSLVVANLRWVALDWKRYTDLHRFQEMTPHYKALCWIKVANLHSITAMESPI